MFRGISSRCWREWIGVILIFLLAFTIYFSIFRRNLLITGVDGPYYLIQVQSLLGNGVLVYGDPPLAFYLFAFFSLLVGDMTLGIELAVSLFCALSTIPVYFLIRRVTGKVYGGYFAMLLMIFSATFIRMMSDFMKNAVGILFLNLFIYSLYNLTLSEKGYKTTILAITFLLLNGFTHILDFCTAILFLAIYSTITILSSKEKIIFMKKLSVIVLSLLAFIILTATFLPFYFTDYIKIIRFFEDISETSEGGLTSITVPRLIPFPKHGPPLPMSWLTLALISTLGFIITIYEWRRGRRRQFSLILTITFMALTFGFPLIPMAWLWRLMLMEFIPTAIILGYGLAKLEVILDVFRVRESSVRAFVILVITGLVLSPFIMQTISIIRFIKPTIDYATYLDLKEMNNLIPPDSVIIAPFPLKYWVQYLNRAEVVGRPSRDLWESYSHVLIIIRKGMPMPRGAESIFIGKSIMLVELPKRH